MAPTVLLVANSINSIWKSIQPTLAIIKIKHDTNYLLSCFCQRTRSIPFKVPSASDWNDHDVNVVVMIFVAFQLLCHAKSSIWRHNATSYLGSNDDISEEICLFGAYFVTMRVQCVRMEINAHCLDSTDRYMVVILLETALFQQYNHHILIGTIQTVCVYPLINASQVIM